MKRLVYRGQIKDETNLLHNLDIDGERIEKLKNDGKVMTLTLFKLGKTLFLYYECIDKFIKPEELFEASVSDMEYFPHTEGYFMPMMDIFHNNKPKDVEQWTRKERVERRIGVVARLKPEMVSSYIFWHYQQQEETPGKGHKYGIISLHENMLFFYKEAPLKSEPAWWKGKLNTHNTPFDTWHTLMNPHFIKWTDAPEGQDVWRECEILLKK
ncbi:MAG: hypothetical protein HFH14_08145 [Lachnospiraceae bacterium]|nr:hypothetical protein [Lachnospiraceae bacterium]